MDSSLVVICDTNDRECVLIDSGFSESPELLDLLKSRGKRAAAVLCTHFHVDHMGNNGLLQREHGAKIYASAREIEVQKERFENDGSFSFEWMSRERYFFGASGKYRSKAVTEDQRTVRAGGASFRVEKLYGHSPAQLGFATPDGVLHIGDAFMTDRVLRHSKVPYELNITRTLRTLEKIKHMDYPFYAASHMGIVERKDLAEAVDANISYHESMLDYIESRLGREWVNMDTFIMEIIDSRGVNIKKSSNMGWLPSAVKSYIDHLIRVGRIVTSGDQASENARASGESSQSRYPKKTEGLLSGYNVLMRKASASV